MRNCQFLSGDGLDERKNILERFFLGGFTSATRCNYGEEVKNGFDRWQKEFYKKRILRLLVLPTRRDCEHTRKTTHTQRTHNKQHISRVLISKEHTNKQHTRYI